MPFCPNCGAELKFADAEICPTCGVRIKDPPKPKGGFPDEKMSWFAALCSFFIPGLGQVYNGQLEKGVLILIGTVIGAIFFLVPGLIVWIYGIFDAYRSAKKMNEGSIPFRTSQTAHMILFFILGIIILIIAYIIAIFFWTFLIGTLFMGAVGLDPEIYEESTFTPSAIFNTVGGNSCGLTIDKTVYNAGDRIVVKFIGSSSYADNAWIGMLPSYITHGNEDDAGYHDLAYHYIGKKLNGELTFVAPSQSGDYDIRMFNTDTCCNGQETCSVSFKVVGGTNKNILRTNCGLTIDKESYYPGERICVDYSGTLSYANNAWIGIIPSYIAHGSEKIADQYNLDFKYIGKYPDGELILSAPLERGEYDVRMFNTDTCCDGKEMCYSSFTVE